MSLNCSSRGASWRGSPWAHGASGGGDSASRGFASHGVDPACCSTARGHAPRKVRGGPSASTSTFRLFSAGRNPFPLSAVSVTHKDVTEEVQGGGHEGGFDFKKYMGDKARLVDDCLDSAVPEVYPELIHAAMRHSLLAGGKRIRPALLLAAFELVHEGEGDEGREALLRSAMPAACAVEMIHTMSLIHDDLPCLDDDDFRRGQPTCHKVFGEDMAVLAGDALLAKSFEHIAAETKGVSAERVLRVVSEVGRCVGSQGLVAGQVVDIKSEGLAREAESVDEILGTLEYIHVHKTAVLLEAAVVAGALLGGGSEEQVEALRAYARKIGLAFQVVDDVLDVTATSEQLGKTAGKDLATDKTTYPSLLGLEESKRIAQELIGEAIGMLDGFDKKKALPLLGLAKYIGSRES